MQVFVQPILGILFTVNNEEILYFSCYLLNSPNIIITLCRGKKIRNTKVLFAQAKNVTTNLQSCAIFLLRQVWFSTESRVSVGPIS
jgi:hypothetical protein